MRPAAQSSALELLRGVAICSPRLEASGLPILGMAWHGIIFRIVPAHIAEDVYLTVSAADTPKSGGKLVLRRQHLSAHEALRHARRPVHPQIQRVRDWIEVEQALARLGVAQEAEAGALQERQ